MHIFDFVFCLSITAGKKDGKGKKPEATEGHLTSESDGVKGKKEAKGQEMKDKPVGCGGRGGGSGGRGGGGGGGGRGGGRGDQ